MKKTRYLFLGAQINCDTNYLVHKLETMSKQGWKLTKVGAVLTFKRAEPEDLQFQVDYLSTDMTWASSEDSFVMDYRQICQDSGWNYCGNFQHLFIFSAPTKQEVTPLQTDEDIKRKTLTTIAIKNMSYFILPLCLILFQNGLTLDVYEIQNLFHNLMFICNWIIIIGSLTYISLTFLQVVRSNGYLKTSYLNTLPKVIPILFNLYMGLLVTLFGSALLSLMFTSISSGLSRAIFLMLLMMGGLSLVTNHIIRNTTFNRGKKILLSLACGLITFFTIIHGTLYFTSTTTLKDESPLPFELPEALQSAQSGEVYFERSSSLILSDYISFSNDRFNFDFYQLRTSVFNQFLDKILAEQKTYSYQYLKSSTHAPFNYEIYETETNQLKGYILSDGINVLIFKFYDEDLNEYDMQSAVSKLFTQLSES